MKNLMSSLKSLRLVVTAGEPDSVLALRIDVVSAAQLWYDAYQGDDYAVVERAEKKLVNAIRKYRRAVDRRGVNHGGMRR